MIAITALACSLGGYLLVDNQFSDRIGQPGRRQW